MLASAQLEILDGFAGPEQARAPRGVRGSATRRERALPRGWRSCATRAGARDRELDLLEWELEEIERGRAERGRGGASWRPSASACAMSRRCARAAAGGAGGAGAGEEDGGGAALALAAAAQALEAVARRRRGARRAGGPRPRARVEAEDLAAELHRYGEGVDAPPGRLDEVEERLAQLDRLKRKHGGTIAAVLAHAETCRARRDELAGAEEALEAARRELARLRAELAERGRRAARARARRRRRARPAPCASGSPRWRWRARVRGALAPRDGSGRPARTRSSS